MSFTATPTIAVCFSCEISLSELDLKVFTEKAKTIISSEVDIYYQNGELHVEIEKDEENLGVTLSGILIEMGYQWNKGKWETG